MSPITATHSVTTSDLLHGFLAGVAGGVVGSGVKSLGEIAYPPRPPDAVTPPGQLADRVARRTAGHDLSDRGRSAATYGIHYTFGPLVAGVYGAVAEAWPFARVGGGLGFAVVLWLLTHESTLPALGLNAPPSRGHGREHVSELMTHGMYATTTEAIRQLIRGPQG